MSCKGYLYGRCEECELTCYPCSNCGEITQTDLMTDDSICFCCWFEGLSDAERENYIKFQNE